MRVLPSGLVNKTPLAVAYAIAANQAVVSSVPFPVVPSLSATTPHWAELWKPPGNNPLAWRPDPARSINEPPSSVPVAAATIS